MKDLVSYGVIEMKAKELKKTDGGYNIPWYITVLGPPANGIYIAYKYIEGKYEQGAACN
tara:strand:+ start:3411 stop:3587 length:177 start_codon:yes stop_codon:yes gene_type:complete